MTGLAADGLLVEPQWLHSRKLHLAGQPRWRVAHFTDLHYSGQRAYLERIIAGINALEPDLACFTGDMFKNSALLGEALVLLATLNAPLFAVPGNWDYHLGTERDFQAIAACCRSTGGDWLVNATVAGPDGLTIIGAVGRGGWLPPADDGPRLLMTHYPNYVDSLAGQRFDLILAGHSHGGQVRVPLLGPLALPSGVGRYSLGLYETPAGPLYVNPGLGTSYLPVRINCRPEITLLEI